MADIFPKVTFQGVTFPVEELIGKTLYAIAKNNVRSTPYVQANNILFTSSPGQLVGIVYSWVVKDNYLWWMLEKPNAKNEYQWVRHSNTSFALKSIQDQGAKTEKQKQEENKKKDQTWIETIKEWLAPTGETLKRMIPVVIVGIGVVWIWKAADKPKFKLSKLKR